MDDFGIGRLQRRVATPGGSEVELNLTRLGEAPGANGGGALLDLVAWVVGRLGGRPWQVTIRPHPVRFGPERSFAFRTRTEAAAALITFADSIPQHGLPEPQDGASS